VATIEKNKYRGKCLTWQEFFEVIQPTKTEGNIGENPKE